MDEIQPQNNEKKSFYFIFHSPLEKVYSVFKSCDLFFSNFLDKCRVTSNSKNSTLDDIGNEISLIFDNKPELEYIIKVESSVNLPYFKSFTHKSIKNPENFSEFSVNFSFFWNSTDKVTIFKFNSSQENKSLRNLFVELIFEKKDIMCLNIENFLINTSQCLEENESISIDKSINTVWEFFSDLNNQKYFYPFNNITIKQKENDTIEIIDNDSKNINVFSYIKNGLNEDKKILQLELISSNMAMPKQKILISLIKMDENQTFVIFKHTILEFIPYDILMSYSSTKKKVLRNIKLIIEDQPLKLVDVKLYE